MSYSFNQGYAAANGALLSGCVGQMAQQQYGGITLSGGGFGFQNINELNMLQQITNELYKDCPPDKFVQDAVYPYNIDIASPYVQFHLIVWRQIEEIRQNFWNIVNLPTATFEYDALPNHVNGRLTFRSRKYRRDFSNWWTTYSNRFYDGIPPVDRFLPRIRPGKISGVFVEQRTMLDQLPYDYDMSAILIHNLTLGLLEALPAWSWIVQNCKRPVCHHSGGWFFTNAAEGAKFTLFNPIKQLGEIT